MESENKNSKMSLPDISKQWLIKELKTKNISQIARDLNVSFYTVQKKMKEYKIKRNFIKPVLSEKLVRFLSIDLNLNDKVVAKIFSCSTNTVKNFRYEYSIYLKERDTLKKIIPLTTFFQLYVQENLTLKQIAKIYDVNIKSVSALKKEYTKEWNKLSKELSRHHSTGQSEIQVSYIKKKRTLKMF